jgi:hypothetical protein
MELDKVFELKLLASAGIDPVFLDERHNRDKIEYDTLLRAHRVLKGKERQCTAVKGETLELRAIDSLPLASKEVRPLAVRDVELVALVLLLAHVVNRINGVNETITTMTTWETNNTRHHRRN